MQQRHEIKTGGELPASLQEILGDPAPAARRDPITGNRRGVATKAARERGEVESAPENGARVGPPKSARMLKLLPLILGPALGLGVAMLRPTEPQLAPLPKRAVAPQVTQAATESIEELPAAKADEWTDPNGSLTRLVGRSPVQVLEAFCAASPDWIAVGVRPTEPERASARLGVVRHRTGGEEHVIGIRAEAKSSRWLAGDGMDPIVPQPLAELLNPNPVDSP